MNVIAVGAILALALQTGYPKLAPFTAVRWTEAETPEVQVDDEWCGLEQLDGHEVPKILEFCRRQYRDRWQKRFGEDLVQVLTEMGREPGPSVTMVLVDLETAKRTTRKDVPMTAENRASVLRHGIAGDPRRQAVLEEATRRVQASSEPLSRAAAVEDVQDLVAALERSHSYLKLKGVDYRAAAAELTSSFGELVTRDDLAVGLMRFLARFGDGHTRLDENPNDLLGRQFLPFLIEFSAGRPVAFSERRDRLVDAKFPYVVALDGRPIEDWLAAAQVLVADGSTQFRLGHGARFLRHLAWVRERLGVPAATEVEVTLGAEKGRRTKTIRMPVADRKPIYGDWPRTTSRVLDGDVGYLRLPDMASLAEKPELARELREWMDTFKETRGLILDVRGNGGGTRDVLALLFPYFLDPKGPPRVVNVAAKRLAPGESPDAEGLLANRALYRRDSPRHADAARRAIDRVTRTFRPEWTLPEGEFSDWHFFVLHPTSEGGTYHYEKPVVVLIDPSCFSATDIFVGAFLGHENTTLIGTPTGGGSGRSGRCTLPRSGLRVRVSSMASFLPNGALYDGNGIAPDVVVQPAPTDFIGATDVVLEAAVRHILKKR